MKMKKSRNESNGAKVCTAHSSNRTKYCCEIDVELNVNVNYPVNGWTQIML